MWPCHAFFRLFVDSTPGPYDYHHQPIIHYWSPPLFQPTQTATCLRLVRTTHGGEYESHVAYRTVRKETYIQTDTHRRRESDSNGELHSDSFTNTERNGGISRLDRKTNKLMTMTNRTKQRKRYTDGDNICLFVCLCLFPYTYRVSHR